MIDQPSITYSAGHLSELAAADLVQGVRRRSLWWDSSTAEIRQRFKRSVLGPFWLTIGMGITVASLALVFGQIFNQDISKQLPYIAIGFVIWGLISATISEGCSAFAAASGLIRNVPMPLSVHIYRVLARNFIVMLHNMVIVVLVWAAFQRTFLLAHFLVLPGLALLMANLWWIVVVVAVLSTRYRDIPPIVGSVLQVLFFVTPVFWSISMLPTRPAFVEVNPIYHLIEIVRAPLLGEHGSLLSWGAAVGMAAIGIPVAVALYRKAYARIPYWV